MKPEFLKVFLQGSHLQLPIKGSQTLKTDNPMIFAAANSTLRELFDRKFRSSCRCTLLPPAVLCQHQHPACSYQDWVIHYYAAVVARLHQIHLIHPIFPDGDNDPLLWTRYRQFLQSLAVTAS